MAEALVFFGSKLREDDVYVAGATVKPSPVPMVKEIKATINVRVILFSIILNEINLRITLADTGREGYRFTIE